METLYQRNNALVGIASRYIYLEELFEKTPRMCRLANSRYVSLSKPLVRTRQDLKKDYKYDKKKKQSWYRTFTLCYAPENYLLREGYDPVTPEERLAYIHIDHDEV